MFDLANSEVSELCELHQSLDTNALQFALRRQSEHLLSELAKILGDMSVALK